MKKILALMAALVVLAGCSSATDSKPSLTVTLTGGGTYAVKSLVTMKASANYAGTGTLRYTWTVDGVATTQTTQTTYYSATAAMTQTIGVTVTDGTVSGSASASVTYQ